MTADIATRPSGLVRLGRAAGNTWLGLGLLAALAAFLSVVSTAHAWLDAPGLNVRDSTAIYRLAPVRWTLLALSLAICANVLLASVFRVPRRAASLGAWCSHAGLLVLAAGALWYYAAAVTRADSVTVRWPGQQHWTPVNHVYMTDTYAAYVYDGSGPPRQVPLPEFPSILPRLDLDIPLARGAGWELRASGFLPNARVVAGVRLRVADEGHTQTVLLSPAQPQHRQFGGKGYVLIYHAGISPQALARLLAPGDANSTPGLAHDLGLVLTGEALPPTLAVIRPDGKRWHATLEAGKVLDVPLAGRTVQVELESIFERAEPAGDEPAMRSPHAPRLPAQPVLEVALTAGGQRRVTALPYAAYEHLVPPQRIALSGGRELRANFSRRRSDLPQTLQVLKARYFTWPGSVVPKDYVCDAAIGGRDETISLNHPVYVGPYQLSQGSWADDPHNPDRIFFSVATRPGLPLVWAGCVLICLGFPLAFYVKPLLARTSRRAQE